MFHRRQLSQSDSSSALCWRSPLAYCSLPLPQNKASETAVVSLQKPTVSHSSLRRPTNQAQALVLTPIHQASPVHYTLHTGNSCFSPSEGAIIATDCRSSRGDMKRMLGWGRAVGVEMEIRF
ncbi:unnamed protein product [Lota lota]